MHSDTGIILRKYALSETSLIIVWLTARHGIQRIVAKGALQPKSQFRGHLDLFFKNELQWSTAKKGDLHHLVGTAIINSHHSVRKHYLNFSLASYFCKLLMLTLESGSSSHEFYDLAERAISYLDANPATWKAMTHFENEMARLHGIHKQGENASISLKKHFGHLPRQRDTLRQSLQGG